MPKLFQHHPDAQALVQALTAVPVPDQQQAVALAMYRSSAVLRQRFTSFDALMAHPVTGRCVAMAAAAVVRNRLQRAKRFGW
ncbi:hypothetical protein [Rhodoferax sp. WC2427]|uniref:hypothetical protein n=1 Tax=Rhodoferax sp. WC2427 TaxID=3234144 RepID=UPI00346722A9